MASTTDKWLAVSLGNASQKHKMGMRSLPTYHSKLAVAIPEQSHNVRAEEQQSSPFTAAGHTPLPKVRSCRKEGEEIMTPPAKTKPDTPSPWRRSSKTALNAVVATVILSNGARRETLQGKKYKKKRQERGSSHQRQRRRPSAISGILPELAASTAQKTGH